MTALSLAVLGLVGGPLIAIVLIGILSHARLSEFINLIAAMLSALCALSLPILVHQETTFVFGYISVEPLAAWVLLCTGTVYLLASIYAIGYMRMLHEDARLPQFYILFALFALTMFLGPLMNNVGLYWIAIELTTLVSTFLIGFEHAPEAIEAAWKYIMVVSAGISLALLGTILLYWAGSLVLGPTYDMTWSALTVVGPRLSKPVLLLGFLLMLIGYGTKVGLAPMHTWLPDAHSEGPAPVSVMLSGALLNTAMIGIVRFLSIADAAGIGRICHIALVTLGTLSLLVASLFIVKQRGVKRLMAYSSIEHMGVIALGFGFGGPLGIAGSLYHMINHSLNKSLMFFGAGNAMRVFGSKEILNIRRVAAHYPVQGLIWLAGAVAITGAPPFGLFLSEFTILRAGFATPSAWAAYAMLLLLIVIFVGFLNQFRKMYDVETRERGTEYSTLSAWCITPMILALIPLLILGFWWPHAFWDYFQLIGSRLGVMP